jgi:hypothetical protein
MNVNYYYGQASRCWFAYLTDNVGQLGDAVHSATKEDALFQLGVEFGRHPEKFTRDIGEYMPAYKLEIKA